MELDRSAMASLLLGWRWKKQRGKCWGLHVLCGLLECPTGFV